jgi:ribosomal protein L37AE/L43A
MSAAQAPAELADLLNRAADRIEELRRAICSAEHAVGAAWTTTNCMQRRCPSDRALVAELRSLLPQPALMCPNCGHPDSQHNGIWKCIEDDCDCPLMGQALEVVRKLLAADAVRRAQATQPVGDPGQAGRRGPFTHPGTRGYDPSHYFGDLCPNGHFDHIVAPAGIR